jgi:hypothetical protein
MENNELNTTIDFNFVDKKYEKAINHFLIYNDVSNNQEKELWLRILQLFFYSQEIDDKEVLIIKVVNYLYTGKLGNGDFTEKYQDFLIDDKKKKKIKEHFSVANNRTDLIKKKNFFLGLYKLYLKILHKYFSEVNLKEPCKTYGKILIYEAPPFKEESFVVDHFLLTGDKYLNAIIDASPGQHFSKDMQAYCNSEFDDFIKAYSDFKIEITPELPRNIQNSIFDFENKEALKDSKKDVIRKNFIEELILMYMKVYPDNKPENFRDKIWTYLTRTTKKSALKFEGEEKIKWTGFFNTLKTVQFKSIGDMKEDLLSNLEKAVTSEIVYIDLILAPIHIDSELRNVWSTKDKFLFEDKQLPVILFEWAIEHFKREIRDIRGEKSNTKQLVSTNCLFAFGTPLNTSVSIYEHFVDKMFLIDTYGPKTQRKENHIDLTQLNSPVAFRKFKNRGRGVVFPMFKSNVIGGNHYPDYRLVKHAFDIEDKEKP